MPPVRRLPGTFEPSTPEMSSADARHGANQLLVTISEYQLMCALHDPSMVSSVVSSQIEQELHPEEEYYDQLPEGTPVDFHQVEQGRTLRFGTFIHRIDQTMTRGIGASQSVRVEEHSAGPLMRLLLGLGTCPLTVDSVIASGHCRKCGDLCRGEEARPFEGAAVSPRAHVLFAGGGCPGEPPQLSGGPCRDQVTEARARHPEGETRQGPASPADSASRSLNAARGTWSLWGSLNALPPQREPLQTS